MPPDREHVADRRQLVDDGVEPRAVARRHQLQPRDSRRRSSRMYDDARTIAVPASAQLMLAVRGDPQPDRRHHGDEYEIWFGVIPVRTSSGHRQRHRAIQVARDRVVLRLDQDPLEQPAGGADLARGRTGWRAIGSVRDRAARSRAGAGDRVIVVAAGELGERGVGRGAIDEERARVPPPGRTSVANASAGANRHARRFPATSGATSGCARAGRRGSRAPAAAPPAASAPRSPSTTSTGGPGAGRDPARAIDEVSPCTRGAARRIGAGQDDRVELHGSAHRYYQTSQRRERSGTIATPRCGCHDDPNSAQGGRSFSVESGVSRRAGNARVTGMVSLLGSHCRRSDTLAANSLIERKAHGLHVAPARDESSCAGAGCATRLRPHTDDTPKTSCPSVASRSCGGRSPASCVGFDQFVIGTGFSSTWSGSRSRAGPRPRRRVRVEPDTDHEQSLFAVTDARSGRARRLPPDRR